MLASTWFVLWGVLWAVYFMLDGFDLGLGALMPFLAKSEKDKRVVLNAMGPFWDGNEVWLITAGGATFAAFPGTYATMFSSMYSALMLLLFALIFRGVSFEFRSKIENSGWKKIWDSTMFIGSLLAAILFGVAFANIFSGLPFDGKGVFHGSLLTLLNPYGILGGIFFLMMFLVHGALWLAIKSDGALSEKATRTARSLWPFLVISALFFLAATYSATDLYENYFNSPILFIIPILAVAGLIMTFIFSASSSWKAWFASCVTIVSVTAFGVTGLYPRLLPSSLNPDFSMTIYNSASSPLTLKIMLGVALTVVPIVIIYQSLVYYTFRSKITDADLAKEEAY